MGKVSVKPLDLKTARTITQEFNRSRVYLETLLTNRTDLTGEQVDGMNYGELVKYGGRVLLKAKRMVAESRTPSSGIEIGSRNVVTQVSGTREVPDYMRPRGQLTFGF